MKILVTGAKGFIGKNLIAELNAQKRHTVQQYDIDSGPAELDEYAKTCDFVFHLAGVNRPKDEIEFQTGNAGFTEKLIVTLAVHGNKPPILMSSSTQAATDNPYGRSKKASEDLIAEYSEASGAPVYIYRLPNVFGKWCRPNYNSVIATFCHNIANGLDIQIHDPKAAITLAYIDDIAAHFISALKGKQQPTSGFSEIPETYTTTVGELAEKLYLFKESRDTREIPDLSDPFTRKLHATYMSYLPKDGFSYPLKMNADARGSFTEFIRTQASGQVSVNISKPGVTKGGHWHHTKAEKFLVVKGSGIIRFRHIGNDEIIEYPANDEKLEVVDIPPGYTHSIENTGGEDMVTVMWANETYDPNKPDTIYEEV